MHAAIVTAYKDLAMLDRLTEALAADGFRIFVHLDRRTQAPDSILDRLAKRGCTVSREFKVYWGSYSHLQAVLSLMKRALTNPEVAYVHVLSGQDFPVPAVETMNRICDGGVFMGTTPMAELGADIRDRYRFYRLLWFMEPWRNIPRPFDRALLWAQRRLGVLRRPRTFKALHKGMIWVSLPRDVARHCLESPKAQRFLAELRWSYLPEEFFFQTVIENSPFRDRIRGAGRYMLWRHKHGTIPGILDLEDHDAVIASGALFARKVDSRISADLIARLAVDAGRSTGPTPLASESPAHHG